LNPPLGSAALCWYPRKRSEIKVGSRATRRLAMPRTGEKPGKGTYRCCNCEVEVTLDDDDDTLPPCPSCDGTEWDKVR